MLIVGLTTLTIQFFPFALPLLILVIAPLAVLALAGLLLALPILLPLWLGRRALRSLWGNRSPPQPVDHHLWAPPERHPAAPRRDRPPAPTP